MDPAQRLLLEVAYEAFENGMFDIMLASPKTQFLRLILDRWYTHGKPPWEPNCSIFWVHDK